MYHAAFMGCSQGRGDFAQDPPHFRHGEWTLRLQSVLQAPALDVVHDEIRSGVLQLPHRMHAENIRV